MTWAFWGFGAGEIEARELVGEGKIKKKNMLKLCMLVVFMSCASALQTAAGAGLRSPALVTRARPCVMQNPFAGLFGTRCIALLPIPCSHQRILSL